ncbi:MAG: FAD synthase [Candidatus Argoarchaeum ethanivorans]|uniref:FAD synthase n=1 Tax=Candidatus Argoarchaeum ethanivorans TaxID=2608793 RepID=A0A811TFA3_9EURY|nr:MAG: FAD synthase [Candidatus Argoarchaeum ethanivorans]
MVLIRVLATGTFDILHPGHITYLRESRKLGDELYVIVARESMILHKPKPFLPEEQRLEVVKALKVVDCAVLGNEIDMFKPLEEIQPAIITLGYNQHFKEEELSEKLKKRGIHAKVVRIKNFESCELCSTRTIVQHIRRL